MNLTAWKESCDHLTYIKSIRDKEKPHARRPEGGHNREIKYKADVNSPHAQKRLLISDDEV
jgi:hypothetical protein